VKRRPLYIVGDTVNLARERDDDEEDSVDPGALQ